MFTELHREEKREEGDRGGQEDKRGTQKERDRSSQESVPEVFSTALNTPRDSQSWVGKRRGREEIEATWWKKGESKGERAIKPVISLPSKNGY